MNGIAHARTQNLIAATSFFIDKVWEWEMKNQRDCIAEEKLLPAVVLFSSE
jgi:hypothetical protein